MSGYSACWIGRMGATRGEMPGMEKFIPMLKGQESVYSLRESTYPRKSHQIELVRTERLGQFTAIWVGLGIFAGVRRLRAVIRALGGNVGYGLGNYRNVGIFIALLMPAGNSARRRSPSQCHERSPQLGMALEAADQTGIKAPPKDAQASGPPARVREWFPETLLWRPELITDDNGQASLTIDLADSITTWRLSASAISAEGQARRHGIADPRIPALLRRSEPAVRPDPRR